MAVQKGDIIFFHGLNPVSMGQAAVQGVKFIGHPTAFLNQVTRGAVGTVNAVHAAIAVTDDEDIMQCQVAHAKYSTPMALEAYLKTNPYWQRVE